MMGKHLALVAVLFSLVAPAAAQETTAPPTAGQAEAIEPSIDSEQESVDRITFEVPFPADKGGGSAAGTAGGLEYVREDLFVATGAVEFQYQSLKLQADRVQVYLDTKSLVAEGNVILDEGPRRLTGKRLIFDLEKKTGTVYEAKAFVDPDIYFTGEEIAKIDEDVYTLKHGTITACAEDRVPDWSFRLGRARVNVDGFARLHNTTARVKKAPVFYSPFMLLPAKRGRVAGFLFPNVGHSNIFGTSVGFAYFQPFGDSYDATLYADVYGEDYLGLGAEFRYRPSHTTVGSAQFFTIDGPTEVASVEIEGEEPLVEDSTRWKATWKHVSDSLPGNMRGAVSYRGFSDFDFFRDFERSFNDISIREIRSNGFLSGSWGQHSLNVLVEDREAFLRTDRETGEAITLTKRQLPEIEYRLRPTQIGNLPLYAQLLGSANYLSAKLTDQPSNSYSRFDVLPTLTMPLSYWPWLSISLSGSLRTTLYGDSVTEDGTEYTGEKLTRTHPAGDAQIVGPSLSRIFEKKIGPFGKFKHIIEPRLGYFYDGESDDQLFVPQFDEVDRLGPRNLFGVSLVNRILAKPADEDSVLGAREILSFELGQGFSLRDEQPLIKHRLFDDEGQEELVESKSGPIVARLRFYPGPRTSLEARADYDTLIAQLDEISILAGLRYSRFNLGLSWVARLDPSTGSTANDTESDGAHQIRLDSNVVLVPNRLRLENHISHDFARGYTQQHRHLIHYNSQCWGVSLEYRDLATRISGRAARNKDVRLMISLKNIGTFRGLGVGETTPIN